MTSSLALRAAVLLAIGSSVSGCVAAAIPLVAGAAVARTATDGEEPGDEERALAARQASEAARMELSNLAAAPPPAAVQDARPASMPNELADNDAYDELIRYAVEQRRDVSDTKPLQSAILADPTTLREKRAPCVADIPTVLIDLDPFGSRFDLDTDGRASPNFVRGLAQLRQEDIAIAWISIHSAADADRVRAALKASGLDPASEDQLILMRYPGDRKQTRRRDLASASCIIAIAGDNRSDFDELFDYLVKPESALALELLIGQGWFLIPPALTPSNTPTTHSTD